MGPLFIQGLDKDYIERSNNPVVLSTSMDPYKGLSLLKFGNDPLNEDENIPTFMRTKKLSPKDSQLKLDYSPAKVNIYSHHLKEKQKKSDVGESVTQRTRQGPSLNHPVACNARTATMWIPMGSKAILGTITLLLGGMFFPTHVTSMPVSELKQKAHIVHASPVYLKP
jgi:hypothetical protein